MKKNNNKKPTYKYLGLLNPEIADYWNINEHKNKPILVYDDRIAHVIDRHLKDFGTENAIMESYYNLENIIKKPSYVYYNKKVSSLEYYKNINYDLCVAVRINPGKVLKVKSWYPVNKAKIDNRKKKEEHEFIENK